jgi:hypothetical protein
MKHVQSGEDFTHTIDHIFIILAADIGGRTKRIID